MGLVKQKNPKGWESCQSDCGSPFDNGVRSDTCPQCIAKLKKEFEKIHGKGSFRAYKN